MYAVRGTVLRRDQREKNAAVTAVLAGAVAWLTIAPSSSHFSDSFTCACARIRCAYFGARPSLCTRYNVDMQILPMKPIFVQAYFVVFAYLFGRVLYSASIWMPFASTSQLQTCSAWHIRTFQRDALPYSFPCLLRCGVTACRLVITAVLTLRANSACVTSNLNTVTFMLPT